MSETDTTTRIQLPAELVERVETRLPRTKWDTPDVYITYMLEEVLYQVEQELGPAETDDIDEQEVRNRLKDLGYLNE